SEGHRRLDRPHVSDLRAATTRCAADRGPWNPQRDPESIWIRGSARARPNRGDGGAMAALLFGGELVSLAEPGRRREFVIGEELSRCYLVRMNSSSDRTFG